MHLYVFRTYVDRACVWCIFKETIVRVSLRVQHCHDPFSTSKLAVCRRLDKAGGIDTVKTLLRADRTAFDLDRIIRLYHSKTIMWPLFLHDE